MVSERVAGLTFSHEVGHSLGSPHDTGGCVGGGEEGHYLMHDTGSLGLRPNNMRLSQCSRSNMSLVLATRHCWSVDTGGQGHCGNGVVEGWEQCDCGDPGQCDDQCCDPGSCRLVSGAQCSPSEGLCCSAECRFLTPDTVCSPASSCRSESRCQGRTPLCPVSASAEDNTLCAGGSRTCVSGECEGSVCIRHGKTPCHPSSVEDTDSACRPHCRDAAGGECLPLQSVSYPAESECQVSGGYGHCSAAGQCRVGADHSPGWLVGTVLFLVFYLLASIAVAWVYCMYCRGGRIRGVKTSVALSSVQSEQSEQSEQT